MGAVKFRKFAYVHVLVHACIHSSMHDHAWSTVSIHETKQYCMHVRFQRQNRLEVIMVQIWALMMIQLVLLWPLLLGLLQDTCAMHA